MKNRRDDKISIITPSFNQAAYIEQTIKSVKAQDYPLVEHIVMDGASTDGTVDVLKRHPHLIWRSEKDRGQADALNKGLALATGDIVGWINSDDYYEENIFGSVVEQFSDPSVGWAVGNLCYVDTVRGWSSRSSSSSPGISYERLMKNPDIVRQQATFFRRSLLEEVGGWNPQFFMVMDFDLWVRLAKISPPRMVDESWAYFRLHELQKTGVENVQRQTVEICKVLKREGAASWSIAKLYAKKHWWLFKGYCREALVGLGVLGDRRFRPR